MSNSTPDKYGWYKPDVIPPIVARYQVYCETQRGKRFHGDAYWNGSEWEVIRTYHDRYLCTVLAWRYPPSFEIPEWLQ